MTVRPPDNRPGPAHTLARAGVTRLSGPSIVFCMPATWPVEEFVAYLRALMREADIADFAELSRLSGVSETQFSNWRRGLSQPSRKSLNRVAPILRVKPVNLWLMAGIADEADLDLTERPDMTVAPREFTDLLELWHDDRLSDPQRDFLRTSVAVLVSGMRGQLADPARGRPNRRPRTA